MSDQSKRDSLKSIWKDPVWSKVIATAIVGASIWIWSRVGSHSFGILTKWLTGTLQVPTWLILLWVVCTFLFCFVWRRPRKVQAGVPRATATPISNPEDVVALVDRWWPKPDSHPEDIAVDYGTLASDLNVQSDLLHAAIDAVAHRNYYKVKFPGKLHATFEYDWKRAYGG